MMWACGSRLLTAVASCIGHGSDTFGYSKDARSNG